MNQCRVSIIVPVYNAEKTLNRCIDSILQQTFTDWELLLINDGSKDHSGEICDEYARKDERVKAFHKKNGGVSSARNIGLDHARGEWITFVDSDDWIVNDCLNMDYSLFQEDLIFFSYYQKNGTLESYVDFPVGNFIFNGEYELNNFYQNFIHKSFFKIIWSKLFKRNLINGLRFDNLIPIGEDHLFLLNYLIRIKTCRFISKPFYVYQLTEDFSKKYQIEVEKSIYIMSSIFSIYDKLRINNKCFEIDIFRDYKSFCQQSIDKRPQLWYGNLIVKKVYSRIKKNLKYSYRLRYALMSNVIFARIRILFK